MKNKIRLAKLLIPSYKVLLKKQFLLNLLHIFVKKTVLKKILFILFFVFSIISVSQNKKKEIFVKYTDNIITVDGVLDEVDWSITSTATNFYESFPNHG